MKTAASSAELWAIGDSTVTRSDAARAHADVGVLLDASGPCVMALDLRKAASAMIVLLIQSPLTAQELTEADAPAGRELVFLEAPASPGASIFCEYEVRDVHFGESWVPLIAIQLDEGAATDQDSKYLQIDMSFVPDEDGTITHNVLKGGFEDLHEETFLIHWRPAPWYQLEVIWEGDGVFRYSANISGGVIAVGKYVQPEFNPKHFRVSLSGLQAGMMCEMD